MSDDEVIEMLGPGTHRDPGGRWVKPKHERELFDAGPNVSGVAEREPDGRARISPAFVGRDPEMIARLKTEERDEDLRRRVAHIMRGEHGDADARRLTIVKGSTLEFRAVEWLEHDQIPACALTLAAGMGGKDKSTIAADYAARATRGQLDGKYTGEPINVLWVGNEDGWEEVVGPRLHMAGADMEHVGFLTLDSESLGDEINIVSDIDAVRDSIEERDFKVVVFDPVVEYLPGATDSHNDMSVRQALRPLRNLAVELGVAVIGLVHLNKGDSVDVAARIAGSAAFRNVARSVLVAADYPEQDGWRVLFQNKSNFGPEHGRGRLYRIEGVDIIDLKGQPVFDSQGKRATTSHIVWGDWVELEPGSLPTRETEREQPKRDDAADMLRTLLKEGPQPAAWLKEQAELDDLSWRTVQRAKTKDGIEARQFHWPDPRRAGPYGGDSPIPTGKPSGWPSPVSLPMANQSTYSTPS
jgi:hypothetical protein